VRQGTIAALAVLVSLLTYSYSDALIWGHIFEAHRLWWADPEYQAGHKVVLDGLLGLGALALLSQGWRWSLWYVAAFYALSQSGAADLLYYWLDGRAVPAVMPWLDTPGHLLMLHPATLWSLALGTGAFALAAPVSGVWLARGNRSVPRTMGVCSTPSKPCTDPVPRVTRTGSHGPLHLASKPLRP